MHWNQLLWFGFLLGRGLYQILDISIMYSSFNDTIIVAVFIIIIGTRLMLSYLDDQAVVFRYQSYRHTGTASLPFI